MDAARRGKVAVVMGASRGLGKATALVLGAAGANVAVAAGTEEAGRIRGTIHETVAQIDAAGGTALAVRCDANAPEDVQGLIDRTLGEFGGVDIIVHNASPMATGRLVDISIGRWDLVWNIIHRAMAALVLGLYPSMKERGGGHIIAVTRREPLESIVGTDYNPAFRLAKNAAADLIDIVAMEGRDEGILANGLWPAGGRDTWGGRIPQPGETFRRGLSGRLFADAVVHLVSQGPRGGTDRFLTDEQVLRDAGVTDFSIYEPKTPEPEFY